MPKKKPPFLFRNYLEFNFIKSHVIKEPASAIAILPDGNMLTGTCDEDGDGEIVLRDAKGRSIKTLVKEAASAIAILPDGNMITGTCDEVGCGSIILRDATGRSIKTLVAEAASAIAILPNGNMLTGTCDEDEDGEIVLRDANGQYIKTLVKEGASAIVILPDGNMITGAGESDRWGISTWGKIVLRDSNAQLIKTLITKPASSIVLLPDGKMIIGICNNEEWGSIKFGKPMLVERKISPVVGATPWLQSVNEGLIEKAITQCLQFQKGFIEEPKSLPAKLPLDMLRLIYSYVFPFPDEKTNKVVNPNCFPNYTEKDIKQVFLADEFAKKISNIKLFPKPNKKIENLPQHRTKKHKKCSIM